MFERFDEGARIVVVDAQAHARRLGHDYVGCEHLLLAVASTEGETGVILRAHGLSPASIEAHTVCLVGTHPEALDADALAAIGIDLDAVRRKVEATFGTDALARRPQPRGRRWWRRRTRCDTSRGYGHLRFTPRAKMCLERSLREADALRRPHVGVEHIALALTSMTDGLAPQLFSALDASPDQVRMAILQRDREAG